MTRASAVGLRAAHILDLAANNGLTIDEVGDPSVDAVRLAKRAYDRLTREGCSAAVKLEAAGLLREGWLPGRKVVFRPVSPKIGRAGQFCANCTRSLEGVPTKVESIGRGESDVVVCAGGAGCDRSSRGPREGNYSFGRDRMM